MNETRTAAILFGGIGGFSAGLMRSKVEAYGKVYDWEVLCSIDFDPTACKNHDMITGEQTSVQMDLFNRDQYQKWFGEEPPEDWKEVTPRDVWQAFGEQVPDYIFLSPPCKGFSGLLPSKSAQSAKYQALNQLTIRGLELCLQACLQYGDELPMFIHFENVPRITTRGKEILAKIKRLLESYGFAYDQRSDHNLGEIGGLGQNRMRFLILARNQKRVPNFAYLPPKKPLKTIGDIIGPLPMPDDPAGGPMHRLPRLQWKPFDGECFCQNEPNGCVPRLATGCPKPAIDWVIVGGESGHKARPMHPDWVRSIRDQCQAAGVPFFFKQWGESVMTSQMPPELYYAIENHGDGIGIGDFFHRVGKKRAGRLLDDREWNEYPQKV